MNGISDKKSEKLRNKAYRDAFVRARVKIGIPYQIRALREQRGWSQGELGAKARKPRNVISRLENPESSGNTIRTCLEMASAFDVALLVKFVSYSRFLKEFEDVSPDALEVPSFVNDPGLTGTVQPRIGKLLSNVVNTITEIGDINALSRASGCGYQINLTVPANTIFPQASDNAWQNHFVSVLAAPKINQGYFPGRIEAPKQNVPVVGMSHVGEQYTPVEPVWVSNGPDYSEPALITGHETR